MSCNRFGALIGFAHAGMTAEGDNRVLMQKVAKEYMTAAPSSEAAQARMHAAAAHPPAISGELLVAQIHTIYDKE